MHAAQSPQTGDRKKRLAFAARPTAKTAAVLSSMLLHPVALHRHLMDLGVAPEGDPVLEALKALLGTPESPDEVSIPHLPTPLPRCAAYPEGRLSPRLLVLLARLIPTQQGDHVLLEGTGMVTLGALLRLLPETRRPDHITVLTSDAPRAEWTLDRVAAEDTDAWTIVASGQAGQWPSDLTRPSFDHILCYRMGRQAQEVAQWLAPDGTATVVDSEQRTGRVIQHVKIGGQGADIALSSHPIQTPPGNAARPLRQVRRKIVSHVTLGTLVAADIMLLHAWQGTAPTGVEQSVLRAVRGTLGREEPTESLDVSQDRRLAERLFHLGYLEQVVATRVGAEALYRASLAAEETAEAWTFYGWVRSQQGTGEQAIDACRRAIEIDPTFGNPYNDIGAYLLAEGDADAAKTWFERATRAPRYAAPHYPYTNLGRVFLREGDLDAARQAVEQALDMVPGYPPAERLLKEIEAREQHDHLGR